MIPHGQQVAGLAGLLAATEVYRLATPIAAALDEVDGDDLKDLIKVNRRGEPWWEWDSDGDPKKLWRYADRATTYLESLPALADVQLANDIVRADLETEPPIPVRMELIFTYLDGANLTATGTYIEMLARKLGQSPRRPTETWERTRPWFPTAAIAAAVDNLLTTTAPEKPAAISDMLDIVGRHSSELIRLATALETMCTAIPALTRITDAVKDVPRPATLRPRGWRPPIDPDEDLPF